MPSLVGVDEFPAVVLSVPIPVGGVVPLQKLVTVLFPYRWERRGILDMQNHKM